MLAVMAPLQVACAQLDFNGSNRFIFRAGEKRLPIFITNLGKSPILLQSSVAWGDGIADVLPLVVSKPMQVILPAQKSAVEVFYEGHGFPEDRESYLVLSLVDVPGRRQDPNLMQIVIQHHFKLFFRPKLNVTLDEAIASVTWVLPSEKSAPLSVSNPSPYYITLSDIERVDQAGKLCGSIIDHLMVAPFSQAVVVAEGCAGLSSDLPSGARYSYVMDDGHMRPYQVLVSPGSSASATTASETWSARQPVGAALRSR